MTRTAYRTGTISSQQNNYLGDKLQKKFRGRVSSAAGRAQRQPRTEKLKKAADYVNPFETSEKRRAPDYAKSRAYAQTSTRPRRNDAAGDKRRLYMMSEAAVNSELRRERMYAGRPADVNSVSRKTRPESYARKRAGTPERDEISRLSAEDRIKAREKALKEDKKRLKAEAAAAEKLEAKKEKLEEVKGERKYVSPVFVLMAALCTVMVMAIIYSYTQIYDYTVEISELKKSCTELEKEEADLRLQLEIRDDIRDIEKIATGTIGMVKSDLVQKKFVSLNDSDDRIEIIGDGMTETDSAAESGNFSTMLSAISENFGRFLEYIK